jgi:CheY-like chemotaxis protein
MAERKANVTADLPDKKIRFLLVVDSDANNLFYTAMLLRRFDYKIQMAATAEEALAMAENAAPSLIITALGLKDMHGLDLVQQLKQNPAIAGVPFIALMRQGDLIEERRCFELGAADCLAQPISPELLFRAVQAAVEPNPRTSIRIRTRLPITVKNLRLDCLKGECVSVLSERGMFLRTRSAAAVDTRLSFQLDLNHALITAEAIVLYSYPTGGGPYHEPGMGLEFVRIAPKDLELIRQFIRNEVTRGIAPEGENEFPAPDGR